MKILLTFSSQNTFLMAIGKFRMDLPGLLEYIFWEYVFIIQCLMEIIFSSLKIRCLGPLFIRQKRIYNCLILNLVRITNAHQERHFAEDFIKWKINCINVSLDRFEFNGNRYHIPSQLFHYSELVILRNAYRLFLKLSQLLSLIRNLKENIQQILFNGYIQSRIRFFFLIDETKK